MQTKFIEYIEAKYPNFTAQKTTMNDQAYELRLLVGGVSQEDAQEAKRLGLSIVKTAEETTVSQTNRTSERFISQQEKDLREFMQGRGSNEIPPEIIEETAAIIAARSNIRNPLAFVLYNCGLFFKEKIALDTPYIFEVKNNPLEGNNHLTFLYNNKTLSLSHKLSEIFIQQVSVGKHSFVFYLNQTKEIGLQVDGQEFLIPLNARPTPPQS